MATRTRGLGGASLLLALAGAASEAQAAPRPHGVAQFDGAWSVVVVTEQGNCDRAYRYGVIVRGGQIYYAGGGDFTISGRVQPSGAVRGSIVRGIDRADVVGRLRGDYGAGAWTSSGTWRCGGYWNGERRGS